MLPPGLGQLVHWGGASVRSLPPLAFCPAVVAARPSSPSALPFAGCRPSLPPPGVTFCSPQEGGGCTLLPPQPLGRLLGSLLFAAQLVPQGRLWCRRLCWAGSSPSPSSPGNRPHLLRPDRPLQLFLQRRRALIMLCARCRGGRLHLSWQSPRPRRTPAGGVLLAVASGRTTGSPPSPINCPSSSSPWPLRREARARSPPLFSRMEVCLSFFPYRQLPCGRLRVGDLDVCTATVFLVARLWRAQPWSRPVQCGSSRLHRCALMAPRLFGLLLAVRERVWELLLRGGRWVSPAPYPLLQAENDGGSYSNPSSYRP